MDPRIFFSPHPLNNSEMRKYYQNKPRFNGVHSRDNLSKIKDGAYVINLYEYSDIKNYWIVLYEFNNNVTFFIVLELNTFQKELKKLLEIKTYKQIFLEYKHMIQ